MERIMTEPMGTYSPIKLGVGAVVIDSEGRFLAVKEKHSRKDNRKLTGMWSHPMETIEIGEEYEETLRRLLFDEEVTNLKIVESNLTSLYLGRVQLSSGIWLQNFLLHAEDNQAKLGKSKDVSKLAWANPKDVLEAPILIFSRNSNHLPKFLNPTVRIWIRKYLEGLVDGQLVSFGCLRWRPGVRESLHAYAEYSKNPTYFSPKSYPVTVDDFPPEIILKEYKEEEHETS